MDNLIPLWVALAHVVYVYNKAPVSRISAVFVVAKECLMLFLPTFRDFFQALRFER